MSASELVTPAHLARQAIIYVRQSSPHQALSNQESLDLQYALSRRATDLGWKPPQVKVIDCDLGQTGSTTEGRQGEAIHSFAKPSKPLAGDLRRFSDVGGRGNPGAPPSSGPGG